MLCSHTLRFVVGVGLVVGQCE